MLRNQENPLIRKIRVLTMWQIRGGILCNGVCIVGQCVGACFAVRGWAFAVKFAPFARGEFSKFPA